MGNLVVGVVVDVLWEVSIKVGELGSVKLVSGAARNFLVLNSAEFVVLHPKVALENLRCSREPEQCRVSGGETASASESSAEFLRTRLGESRLAIGQ